MMRRSILSAVLLASAMSASAAQFIATERKNFELPMFIAGTFVIENPEGDIDVVGTDDANATVYYLKTITAIDDAAKEEGRRMSVVQVTGDERQRFLRTWISPVRRLNWNANLSYTVRLPRTANLLIHSGNSNHIRVSDMRGNVRVKNFNGVIVLERTLGQTLVESANGNIAFTMPPQLNADVQLTSINGSVEVHAPPSAAFGWVAETVRGETKASLPVQGTFSGTKFRGYLNSPGSATLVTNSLLGNVFLLRNGTTAAESTLVSQLVPPQRQQRPQQDAAAPGAPGEPYQKPVVKGFFKMVTPMGDIIIGEVRGDANIVTRAGAVQLGAVTGELQLESGGGPLTLGVITGPLNARTAAGDVLVQSAREGGTIATGGGIIRLLYTGGPTRLESGGGDIIVNANGPVNAETRSGDITINLDRGARSQRLVARTAKGNVLINVGSGFGADVDATVMTTDANANTIRSEFPGLTLQRDQLGSKTRIRATGKINGGGERMELFAEDGGIQITTATPK